MKRMIYRSLIGLDLGLGCNKWKNIEKKASSHGVYIMPLLQNATAVSKGITRGQSGCISLK